MQILKKYNKKAQYKYCNYNLEIDIAIKIFIKFGVEKIRCIHIVLQLLFEKISNIKEQIFFDKRYLLDIEYNFLASQLFYF
jgi:hypothetical protein